MKGEGKERERRERKRERTRDRDRQTHRDIAKQRIQNPQTKKGYRSKENTD